MKWKQKMSLYYFGGIVLITLVGGMERITNCLLRFIDLFFGITTNITTRATEKRAEHSVFQLAALVPEVTFGDPNVLSWISVTFFVFFFWRASDIATCHLSGSSAGTSRRIRIQTQCSSVAGYPMSVSGQVNALTIVGGH